MRTLGLDISATSTGVAIVGGEEDKGTAIQLPDMKGFQRLHLIAQNVAFRVDTWKPELAVIEKYAFLRFTSVDTFITLVECGTVIRKVLYDKGVPWVTVTPTTLKKWTTGNGSADKDDMAVAVKNRWGFRSPSNDIIDAYALAQMGQLEMKELLSIKGVMPGN